LESSEKWGSRGRGGREGSREEEERMAGRVRESCAGCAKEMLNSPFGLLKELG